MFESEKPLFSIEYDSYLVTVSFEDGIFVNQDKQQEDDLKAVVAGVMPKKQFLIRNYNLNEEELEDWLAALKDEMPEAGSTERRSQDALFDLGD